MYKKLKLLTFITSKGIYINKPKKKAKTILLLVFTCNSEILISINISINKNKIDTAPIYTSKYEIPIKFIPINIK